MELPYFSSHFLNQTAPSPSLVVQKQWSYEENKAFENVLAENILEFPDIFHKISLIIPGKNIDEIKENYEALVDDLETIESCGYSLPNYKDDDDHDPMAGGGRPKSKKRAIRWTKEEHEKFLMGLEKYGKGDWKSISRNCVVTKNPTQVASHAQKYYIRLQKSVLNKPPASLVVVHSPIQSHMPSAPHIQL